MSQREPPWHKAFWGLYLSASQDQYIAAFSSKSCVFLKFILYFLLCWETGPSILLFQTHKKFKTRCHCYHQSNGKHFMTHDIYVTKHLKSWYFSVVQLGILNPVPKDQRILWHQTKGIPVANGLYLHIRAITAIGLLM